jgi:uncharacterized protein
MTRDRALQILREHEADLKAKGVVHLRLFGSVARDEANEGSDVDVIVDFDPAMRLSLLHMSDVWGDLHEFLGKDIDLVREKTLRPHLKDRVLREAVSAF